MDILTILAKDHDKWCKIVENMGANKAFSEDIVQDAYIKVAEMKNPLRMLYKENEANHYYFYLVLNSVYIDSVRKKKVDTTPMWVHESHEPLDTEKEEAFERLYQKTIAFINDMGKYGSVLSQMYFKTNYSLRDLSEMGEIGLSSLYNSIKKYREAIRESLGEDYEDFMNQDYDKI